MKKLTITMLLLSLAGCGAISPVTVPRGSCADYDVLACEVRIKLTRCVCMDRDNIYPVFEEGWQETE